MKPQSSVEFLLTYAWAFLSIAVFLAFVFAIVTVKNPTSFTPSSCYISPSFTCISSVFMANSVSSKFIVLFQNNIGQSISFPSVNAIILIPTFSGQNYGGSCLPVNAVKGATITCNITIGRQIASQGTQINPKFTLNYELCQNNLCSSPVVSTNTINTTGFSTMQVSPQVPNPIIYVTVQTSPVPGQVVVNGAHYPSNSQVIFLYKTSYTIYGLPPSGYAFGSWTVNGGASVVSSTTQNTIAQSSTPGNIIANFVLTTTSTTSSSTTTASSSSSSSTTMSTTSSTTSTSTTSTTSLSTTSTSTSTSTTSTSTSTSTTTTIPPPSLDGHAAASQTSAASSVTPTFSTTHANDMLVAVIFSDGGTGPPGITDTASSTWHLEYGGTPGLAGNCGAGWVYYATPGHTVTNDAVTGSVSGSSYVGALVFAVNNAESFDPNVSLPPTSSGSITMSTTNAHDFIVAISTGSCSVGGFSMTWPGAAALDSISFPGAGTWYGDDYEIVSSVQTNLAVSVTSGYKITGFALSST